MKGKTLILVLLLLLVFLGTLAAGYGGAPEVLVDGRALDFDVAPQVEAGRVLVPLRRIFEALGAKVSYEANTQTVRAVRGSDIISLTIGSRQAWVNGKSVVLEVPARIVESRTLVPLRFVSEALGADVFWDEGERQVQIDTGAEMPLGVLRDYTDASGIHRVFRWTFAGKAEVLEVVVNAGQYREFLYHARIPSDDYSIYVTHPGDDAAIEDLVVSFRKIAALRGFSEKTLVEYVIAFVQALAYSLDVDANGVSEYPQYPLETLVVKGGDCEDTAILLAALLEAMGHEAVIVHYPGVHTGVGIWMTWDRASLRYEVNGRLYTYIETTVPYPIGRIPPEFQGLEPTFFALVPQPAVRFVWETNATGMAVRVNNEGTGAAERLTVRAGFQGRDGSIYNQSMSKTYWLGQGEALQVQLPLIYPVVEYRYVVEIFNGKTLMAYDRSRWYGTGN